MIIILMIMMIIIIVIIISVKQRSKVASVLGAIATPRPVQPTSHIWQYFQMFTLCFGMMT